MKYAYQAELVVNEAMKRYPKGRFLFLTLTIKNVSGKELNKTFQFNVVRFHDDGETSPSNQIR